MKTFHKQKLKKFTATKPALQKIIEEILHTKEIRVRQKHARKTKPF
jgi:hypothetical protein